MMRRILSMMLALLMVVTSLPLSSMAAEGEKEGHEHSWTEATCTSPKTCTDCGATEGTALEHSGGTATCATQAVCDVCGESYGELKNHDEVSNDAKAPTCTEIGWDAYVTCSLCDYTTYTEISATGHNWADATCSAPKTCSVCQATEGEAAGHSWVDATCAAPKTCSVCQATEGEALGHTLVDGKCTACDYESTDVTDPPELCTHGNTAADCSICAAQNLINALPDPEGVTAEDKDELDDDLNAIVQAVAAIPDADREKLDLSRYYAVVEKLEGPQDEPMAAMQLGISMTRKVAGVGLSCNLNVEPTDRIEEVKAKIQDEWGYAPSIQVLTFNETKLEDGNTLQDYSIQKDSTLSLTIEATPVTVTFDANGGSVTPASAQTTTEGLLETLPVPTKEGRTFEGWVTDLDTMKRVNDGSVVHYTAFAENTTIYAVWSVPTTVSIIWVGDTPEMRPDSVGMVWTLPDGRGWGDQITEQNWTVTFGIDEHRNYTFSISLPDSHKDLYTVSYDGYTVTMTHVHKYVDGSCVCGVVEEASNLASGECGAEGDNLLWALAKDGTLTISGTGAMADYTYDAPWDSHSSKILAVVIEEGITEIGNCAFYECGQMTSVSIPGTVTRIGESAFSYCYKLSAVTIPSSVTTIGKYAFSSCNSLTSIEIPGSVTAIGDYAFNYCYRLTQITFLGDRPGTMGSSAFCNVTANVIFPAYNDTHKSYTTGIMGHFGGTLTWRDTEGNRDSGTCGENAKWNVTEDWELIITGSGAMTDYIASNSYDENNTEAPWHCYRYNITKLAVHDSITEIGNRAFRDCDSITEAAITAPVTRIGDSAFYDCGALTAVSLPASVTHIGTYAFSNCDRLTEITIPASVTQIGTSAFSYCSALKQITFLPETAPTMGVEYSNYPFSGVTASVTYPANNDTYTSSFKASCGGDLVFTDTAGNLASGKIGDLTWILSAEGVLTVSGSGVIPSYSYDGAPWYFDRNRVKEIVIGDGITQIGKYAFYCCAAEEVTIPLSVVSINAEAFNSCSTVNRVNTESLSQWLNLGCGNGFDGYELYLSGELITDLVIPDGVSKIGEGQFRNCTTLQSVTIPNSLATVESRAFYGCTGLQSISFPEGADLYLSQESFYGCTGLTALEIPDGINVGYNAFYGCTGLKTLTWDNSNTWEDRQFMNCTSLETVTILGGSIVSYSAFSGCTSLTSVTLADTITQIQKEAFLDCQALTSIQLPDGLKIIGERAFKNCAALTEMTIPGGITQIGANAFIATGITKLNFMGMPPVTMAPDAMYGLTLEVSYPVGIQAWESLAASNTYGGANVTWVPQGSGDILRQGTCGENLSWTLDSAGLLTIYGSGEMTDYTNNAPWRDFSEDIQGIRFVGGITRIGDYAFTWCENLTSVTIPDTVEYIGEYAFQNCIRLTQLNLSEYTRHYGFKCFTECTSLTSVVLPECPDGTSYGQGIFMNCTNLQSATLEGSNIPVTHEMFRGCKKLSDVALLGKITYIGCGAFLECTSLKQINLPSGIERIENDAFAECANLASIAIPDGVVQINGGAFYNCTSLTSITLPASVQQIYSGAFASCTSLKTIKFNGRAPVFDGQAFYGVTATATYPEKYKSSWTAEKKQNYGGKITWIDYDITAGSGGEELPDGMTWELSGSTLTIRGTGDMADYVARSGRAPWSDYAEEIKTIILQGSITRIGAYAFAGCINAVTVEIPNTVTSIGYGAFQGCEALQSVGYGSTKDQWTQIQIEDGNEILESVTILEPAHVHRKVKLTIPAVTCTAEAPGNKAYTTYVCDICGIWLTSSGKEMSAEEIEALQAKYRTYVKVTSVTLMNGEEPWDASANWNLSTGTTLQLSAQVLPIGAKQTVTWSSSSKSVATVSADGLVTFLKPGTVTIKAAGANKKTDSLKLTLSVWPEGVKIIAPETFLRSGSSMTLTKEFTPADTTNQNVTWSVSDSSIATISSKGKLSAKTVYEEMPLTVTAVSKADPSLTAAYELQILPKTDTVMAIHANGESVTGKTISCDIDESYQLQAVTARVPEEGVTWKSSRSGASVDENGVLTFTKSGTYTITAKSTDGRTAKATFKVSVLTQSIAISSKNGSTKLASGKTLTLVKEVLPANAANKNVKWRISEGAEYAKVSSKGVVTAYKGLDEIQTVIVTAEAADGSGVSQDFEITLRPIVTKVVIDQGTSGKLDMAENNTLELTAYCEPSELCIPDVVWSSSNTRIATVDKYTGKVTALKGGTVTITAQAADGSGKYARYKLTVHTTMETLELPGALDITAGKNYTFKPVIGPSNVTNKKLAWSVSDTAYASISSSGVLKTKTVSQRSSVTVTAESTDGSGLSSSCVVTIYPKATKVQIFHADGTDASATIKLWVGQTLDLTSAVSSPEARQEITWSSSRKNYASVSEEGRITALKPGTTTITAKAADGTGKYDTVKVQVLQPIESLTLPETKALTEGKSFTFRASIAPSNASVKTLEWFLAEGDEAYAQFDPAKRILKARDVEQAQTVTVYAKATDISGLVAKCQVTIYPKTERVQIASGNDILSGTVTVNLGQTLDLSAVLTPADAYQSVTWSRNTSSYLNISSDGVVTPKKPGTTKITAKASDGSGKSASISVKVLRPVEEVQLPESRILVAGKTSKFKATVLPTNASNTGVVWSLAGAGSWASIDEATGTVKTNPVEEPQVFTVVATAKDGSGCSAQCEVYLFPVSASKITLYQDDTAVSSTILTVRVGQTLELSSEVHPDIACQEVSWSVSGSSYASISADGTVTGKRAGTATVYARALDGSGVSKSIKIRVVK